MDFGRLVMSAEVSLQSFLTHHEMIDGYKAMLNSEDKNHIK